MIRGWNKFEIEELTSVPKSCHGADCADNNSESHMKIL